ncbi:MAG: 30S ribosomal protein S12 methylthiotransferase RimO [Fretibacterium sp.]|nr:30S ribosomal protein S12 methylthiotransferase RimO [Fretibacterium sp.]
MNVFLVSMGCAKNTVDSERLMGRLTALGHRAVEDPHEAEVGIINTCGFIQDAVKENIDAILDLEQMKEQGVLPHIIVAGCLVNRYEAELRKELPTVDLFARAEEWDTVAAFLQDLTRGAAGKAAHPRASGGIRPSRPSGEPPCPSQGPEGNGGAPQRSCQRVNLLPGTPWSRYLKVSEGCSTCCSYCAIPLIRGGLRSTPVEQLVEEAQGLCAAGAKELCLVGQDLTVYGQDLYGEPALRRLLSGLNSALPDGTWLRLLYLHPDRVTEELADFLLGTEKVLHYLDIPIQHINDGILTRMNRSRGSSGTHIRRIFRALRKRDPLFTLRTTVMTGFPGETETAFQELCDFIQEAEPDHAGAFVYSPEEGTPAASFPDAVPGEIAEERCARLMELQSAAARERSGLFIGKDLDVLIEETDPEAGEAWGRSYRDAPEVDGMVCVQSEASGELPQPGEKIRVHVTDCAEQDLFGEPVEGGEQ